MSLKNSNDTIGDKIMLTAEIKKKVCWSCRYSFTIPSCSGIEHQPGAHRNLKNTSPPPHVIAGVDTPRCHNSGPEYCLLSGEWNPVQNNLNKVQYSIRSGAALTGWTSLAEILDRSCIYVAAILPFRWSEK
jgi:hypothetical protein